MPSAICNEKTLSLSPDGAAGSAEVYKEDCCRFVLELTLCKTLDLLIALPVINADSNPNSGIYTVFMETSFVEKFPTAR